MTKKVSETNEPIGDFEKAFDSENRRSKTHAFIIVVMFITAIGYAFTMTIYHLGSLNAHVSGVFEIKDDEKLVPSKAKKGSEYPNLDR